MFGLGTQEILLLLVMGVLLFGRNLPQLGRSVGKTFVEFKKGMKGLEDEMEPSGSPRTTHVEPEPMRPPQRVTATTPKFDDTPAGTTPTTPTRLS